MWDVAVHCGLERKSSQLKAKTMKYLLIKKMQLWSCAVLLYTDVDLYTAPYLGLMSYHSVLTVS